MQKTYKLISLNTWGGREYPEYEKFLEDTVTTTDIYCFQEMCGGSVNGYTDGGRRINQLALTNQIIRPLHHDLENRYDSFPKSSHVFPWGISIATGIQKSKTFLVTSIHTDYVFGFRHQAFGPVGSYAVAMQSMGLQTEDDKRFTVYNIHGFYAGPGIGKGDMPERIVQSHNIIEIIRANPHPWILCGDFNLDPDTKSIQMIEEGLQCANLIQQFGIKGTRTRLYDVEKRRKYPHADYVFTKGVTVQDFQVDTDSIASDHAPLSLTFSLD